MKKKNNQLPLFVFYSSVIFLSLLPITAYTQGNYRNVASPLEGTTLNASGRLCARSESSEKVIDGKKGPSRSHKWCCLGAPNWIMLDLGQQRRIDKIIITHAGHVEMISYNTADFRLQYSPDKKSWLDIVSPIYGNQSSVTTHTFKPIVTEFVRLYITKPEQRGNRACRIYEIEVYGTDALPPSLSTKVSFSGQDNILKAGQSGALSVTIQNKGGDAHDVSVRVSNPNKIHGLSFSHSQSIPTIPAGESRTISFHLLADQKLKGGTIDFIVQVSADRGHSATTSLTVSTKLYYTLPKYPADLYIEDLQFIEPSHNKALDGYEAGKIWFTLSNKGRGEAQNIQISLSPLTSADGLSFTPAQVVERIDPKGSAQVTFSITADGRVSSLPRTFRIQATEEFGFDADPVRINFETREFEAPDLRIEKIAINDHDEGDAYGNGNSIIEPNESIVVTAFVQNLGSGPGEEVKAKILVDDTDPNLQCPDDRRVFDLATISPGDYKPVSFYFFTSKRYSATNIPIRISLSESRGDYGKTIDLGLKMHERTPNVIDITIAKIEIPKPEVKTIAELFMSDVDEIPQKSKNRKPDDFAVIIGIEVYKYAPKVTYAERDASAFYNYAVQVLGIPERNIYYLVNESATLGEFNKLFDKGGWIARRATPRSQIFVYYSGHGAPNLKDKSPYIIPYDIDPNYASTGFSLNTMYEALSGLNAKSVTVTLDACFSGQSREQEMLLAGARPVYVKIGSPLAFGNLTVLAAAGSNQISSSYPEQRHGIFTYFLLKGLQGYADLNADKNITVDELFNYLKPQVKRTAGFLDREQTPSLITKDAKRILVSY